MDQLPGFDRAPFDVYSGLLDVPGPINGYDALKIHYQFHASQGNPTTDPVVTWNQGGPGSSSISLGLYTELGYFQVDDDGPRVNPHAWNRVANMLYFEAPAGSGSIGGSSVCLNGSEPVTCEWSDTTQAEAYAHTLQAFFEAFPEYSQNNLYLTGESYFGIYGPNIASYILNTPPFSSTINLKGLALGNACWGGDEQSVRCNGPNSQKHEIDFFFGKGLFSRKLRQEIESACDFSVKPLSRECQNSLVEMRKQVGPHDVYNVYENCPKTAAFLQHTGKDMEWLTQQLHSGMSAPHETHKLLLDMGGGFDWACGGQHATQQWIKRPDVRSALHLDAYKAGASRFQYSSTGPASVTLYPELIQKLRILIFSGDADACVPYLGNEEWISGFEATGLLEESAPWSPWFSDGTSAAPAGYVTEYTAPGSSKDFSFATVRLAGHMVPTYQPEAAFSMFARWVGARPLSERPVV